MGFRIGLGSDIHRLRPGAGLRLGGVDVPCRWSCQAISDGDVLLHALVDAILGALGRGDIGEHFPPSLTVPGHDSRLFLGHAMHLLEEDGARVVNADCIIDLERPSLREWKPRIRDSLAEMLRIAPERVGVKAKTAEGLGPVGEGLAVAARAAALIETRN